MTDTNPTANQRTAFEKWANSKGLDPASRAAGEYWEVWQASASAQETKSPTTLVDSLRERFERWATSEGLNIDREPSPFRRKRETRMVYVNPSMELSWQAVMAMSRPPVGTEFAVDRIDWRGLCLRLRDAAEREDVYRTEAGKHTARRKLREVCQQVDAAAKAQPVEVSGLRQPGAPPSENVVVGPGDTPGL